MYIIKIVSLLKKMGYFITEMFTPHFFYQRSREFKGLKSKGYFDLKVVSAIYLEVESGSLDRKSCNLIIDSYVVKVIVSNISGYFSNRNVGEVLDILYKKYSEGIANKAVYVFKIAVFNRLNLRVC